MDTSYPVLNFRSEGPATQRVSGLAFLSGLNVRIKCNRISNRLVLDCEQLNCNHVSEKNAEAAGEYKQVKTKVVERGAYC